MRIIEPKRLPERRPKRRRKLKFGVLFTLAIFTAVGALLFNLAMSPFAPVVPVAEAVAVPKSKAISLPWPEQGYAAVGAEGFGVLSSHRGDQRVPIASISKIITAMAVLDKKPLVVDEQGPDISISQEDIVIFQEYLAKDGVVIPVVLGEAFTQYEAMRAMLIVSANNMADKLAIWAFGSLMEYTDYANKMLQDMGLSNTSVADASGFSPQNKSTAEDLVLLALRASKDPIISQIVAQKTYKLNETTTINNTNRVLGVNGINGIKTGTTDEAGGCFLLSSVKTLPSGQKIKVVGAVLDADTTDIAMNDADSLARRAATGFETVDVVKQDQRFASYSLPWGGQAYAVADEDVSLLSWKGSEIQLTVEPHSYMLTTGDGSDAGVVQVTSDFINKSVRLRLDGAITRPDLWWRVRESLPSNLAERI